jgi:hypothetical protein
MSDHRDDEEIPVKEICAVLKMSRAKFFQLSRSGALETHLTMTGRRVMWKSDLQAARERAAQRKTKR